MEKSFDLGTALRNHQKKHMGIPAHFSSVAVGLKNRRESTKNIRRDSRCTLFDRAREIATCATPEQKSETQKKLERRKQQLEKYKEEKEKKKKEQAALKKKPFLVGVASAPKTFVGPPPLPIKKQTILGRVTRSQTRSKAQSPTPTNTKSFAPKNASFRPPKIIAMTSNAVLPKTEKLNRAQSKTLPIRQAATDIKKPTPVETKRDTKKLSNKPPPKASRFTKTSSQSSFSGTEIEANKKLSQCTQTSIEFNTRTYNKSRKCNGSTKATVCPQNSSGSDTEATTSNRARKVIAHDSSSPDETTAKRSIKRTQTPGHVKANTRTDKQLIVKLFALSSSSEKSSSDMESSAPNTRRKSVRYSLNTGQNSSDVSSETKSSTCIDTRVISDSIDIVQENAGAVEAKTPTRNSRSSSNSDVIFIAAGTSEVAVENTCAAEETSNTMNTPKTLQVPRSESNSEQKYRSPKSPLTPEQVEWARRHSPNVTLSRGKQNATKEQKWKLNAGLLDHAADDDEEVRPFRLQLDSDVKRMTEMCETWEKIMEHTPLPDAAQEEVRCAVGQARLLMSKKLEQFRTLVDRCARPDPAAGLVTPEDLQGFWDMVHMQVKNVDVRFARLSELRARGWAEERPSGAPMGTGPALGRRRARPPRPPASSGLREVIAARRKQAREQAEQALLPSVIAVDQKDEERADRSLLVPTEKTFEAGFFMVCSPVRSPRPRVQAGLSTPTGGLRKAVVSSEARKAENVSVAMLRASSIGKCEYKLTPVAPINLDATPGRSILKSAKSSKLSPNKSVKIVLFTSDLDTSSTSKDSEQDDETVTSTAFDKNRSCEADVAGKSVLMRRRNTRSQNRNPMNDKKDSETDENKEMDVPMSSSRTLRSTRQAVQEKLKMLALQEMSDNSVETYKTNVLKEKANNAKGTPRKSFGRRRSVM